LRLCLSAKYLDIQRSIINHGLIAGTEISVTNRVHIDAPAGVIEIEGEKEFVEGLLARLFPLIEEAGFGSRPLPAERLQMPVDEQPGSRGTPTESRMAPDMAKKPPRRAVKMPPAGQSCPARIQVLKDEGYFKEHRAPNDIVGKLREKGWTHNLNQVGAATSALFNKGVLQRTKDGKGPWLYFWDRA
jgi:hypothetical protein